MVRLCGGPFPGFLMPGGRELETLSLIKDTNPVMGLPPLWPHPNLITSQRSHPMPSYWELGFPMDLRGRKHVVHHTWVS